MVTYLAAAALFAIGAWFLGQSHPRPALPYTLCLTWGVLFLVAAVLCVVLPWVGR